MRTIGFRWLCLIGASLLLWGVAVWAVWFAIQAIFKMVELLANIFLIGVGYA